MKKFLKKYATPMGGSGYAWVIFADNPLNYNFGDVVYYTTESSFCLSGPNEQMEESFWIRYLNSNYIEE